jgi:hypothetical protein
MSDLNFSSTEVYQCANRVDAIAAPRFDNRDCGSLSGGIHGSEDAARIYQNVRVLADYQLDRAARGLDAFPQILRTIARRFEGQERINADQLNDTWADTFGPLSGTRLEDGPPLVPTATTDSLADILSGLLAPPRR